MGLQLHVRIKTCGEPQNLIPNCIGRTEFILRIWLLLAQLLHVEHTEKSYICSNSQPLPLHEIIQWFQQQLGLHLLFYFESDNFKL